MGKRNLKFTLKRQIPEVNRLASWLQNRSLVEFSITNEKGEVLNVPDDAKLELRIMSPNHDAVQFKYPIGVTDAD